MASKIHPLVSRASTMGQTNQKQQTSQEDPNVMALLITKTAALIGKMGLRNASSRLSCTYKLPKKLNEYVNAKSEKQW